MEARRVTAARSAVGAGLAAIVCGPSGRLPAQRRRHSSGKGHLNRHTAAKGPLVKFEALTIKDGLLTGAESDQSWQFRASAKSLFGLVIQQVRKTVQAIHRQALEPAR